MARFRCPQLSTLRPLDWSPTAPSTVEMAARLSLEPEEAHHAVRVLRLRAGAPVMLHDGQGHQGDGVIQSIEPAGRRQSEPQVWVCVNTLRWSPPLRPRLELAVPIPKAGHAGEMVSQLAQVGADAIIPLATARAVVDPSTGKLAKLARVAIESAKQCGRLYDLALAAPSTLPELLSHPCALRLIAQPGSRPDPDLAHQLRSVTRVQVLIGPEGGWTPEELAQAQAAGCRPLWLGPYVQRIETAAVTATALARYLVGPTSQGE